MAKHYNIGYALNTNPAGSEFWYKQIAVPRRIVVACGKGIVGSWLGFECHYQYDGYFADNGLQENFQKLLGIGFTGANIGIWLGDTNYAGSYNIVWVQSITAIRPSIATGVYYGSVSLSVITHLGGDYYNVNAVISVKGAVYSHTYANVYIPSTYTNTVVVGCMNGFGTGGTQAHIYNIQVPDDWRFTLPDASVTPKKSLCVIGKKSATGPNFKTSNYSDLVNASLSQNSIIISNNGYTASQAIPQLGSTHHIIQKYACSALAGSQWTNYIGWYGENDTTLHGDVLISGVANVVDNRSFHVWAHTTAGSTQEGILPENMYPNDGVRIDNLNTYVRWVSIKRVFDTEIVLGYIYSTVIVDVYDANMVFAHHEYRSKEIYSGNPIRFVSQISDPDSLVTITTEHEQFVATSGLEDDCLGVIITDFDHEVDEIDTLKINFIDKTVSQFEITSYLWDFGDGTTSTHQNPVKTFTIVGLINVTLTVTDVEGNSNSITKKIKITEVNRIHLLPFDGSGSPVFLPMPQLDNSTEINMAFKVHQTSDKTIRYFDNGQEYDSIISTSKYILTKEEIDNFIDFYENQTKGRAEVFKLFLKHRKTGFFPFGPDFFDSVTFFVKFKEVKWTTRLNKPWGMYELELSLHLISTPDYEIPTTTYKQGSFILDDLVNLPNPEIQYNYEKHLFSRTSLGGKLNNVDIGLSDYMHSSNLSFDISVQNAGLLINKLKSIRTNTFIITSPQNCYPFGSKIGSGSFLVNLLDNTIKITHNGQNNFRIEFQVGLQNVL